MACWTTILKIFSDPEVSELHLNGAASSLVLKRQFWQTHSSYFNDDDELTSWLQDQAFSKGQRLDPRCPVAGGLVYHSGEPFRWHAVIPPIASSGAVLSVRRHRFSTITLSDFDASPSTLMKLESIIAQKTPVIIGGPTGSGKSSLLHALLSTYCQKERVMILESYPEMSCTSPMWSRLIEKTEDYDGHGAFTMMDAFYNALRLRPDRIIVGEIRGDEATAFLQSLLTGHRGVMSTLHVGEFDDVVPRLSRLARWNEQATLRALSGCTFIKMQRSNPPTVSNLRDFTSTNLPPTKSSAF